jgi:hypothetical protein
MGAARNVRCALQSRGLDVDQVLRGEYAMDHLVGPDVSTCHDDQNG